MGSERLYALQATDGAISPALDHHQRSTLEPRRYATFLVVQRAAP
jgi:hypothetical protein